MIRALEHARVTMSIEVESAPTVLHVFEQDGSKYVLFGTVNGKIGLLDLEKSAGSSLSAKAHLSFTISGKIPSANGCLTTENTPARLLVSAAQKWRAKVVKIWWSPDKTET